MPRTVDCGHEIPDLPPGPCGGTGYGLDRDGRTMCYACCGEADKKELLDRSKPFTAYLSSDGLSITNWPGTPLMQVTRYRKTAGFGGGLVAVSARDIHGGFWHGRGAGKSMLIRLHPSKKGV